MTHLMDALESERARHFAGLAGSWLDVTLPVRQAMVDAALAQVRDWPGPLEALGVGIGSDNTLHITAAIKVFGFRKQMHLRVRIAPAMDDGVVHLFLDDRSLGSSAVAWLGPLFGKLPEGVTLHGRQISVHVHQLTAQQGLAALARLLTTASFRSEDGILWIDARAEVPESTGLADVPPRLPAGHAQHPLFTVDELLEWLRGTRADADVRIDERLANALLSAAHADAHDRARAGSAPTDPAAVAAGALQRADVRFEQGAMRLTLSGNLDPPSEPPD